MVPVAVGEVLVSRRWLRSCDGGAGNVGMLREHPYRLELLIPQQVSVCDDQEVGLAELVALGGEQGGAVGCEPGVAAVMLAGEGRDDHLVQPPHADLRVPQ